MKDYLILESKDYPLYKGVLDEIMLKIVQSGFIIATKEFDNPMRKNITNKDVISATRNKNFSTQYGSYIIIFDTKKLSSNFKIIPFSENPDFYLDLQDKYNLKFKNGDYLKKVLKFKEYGDIYWKVKTDRKHFDFDIAEELIIADKIDIKRYVKKIIKTEYKKELDNDNKFDYWNKNNISINKFDTNTLLIKNKLDELGIDNNIIIK